MAIGNINNTSDIDSYIGSSDIEESRNGDTIDIILGETTIIKCSTTIILSNTDINTDQDARLFNIPSEEFNKNRLSDGNKRTKYIDDKRWHVLTENISIYITNHNSERSLLLVKHYIGNKMLLKAECQSYNRRSDGFIEWILDIPQNTDTVFTCGVTTAAYY